jgi:murein tripeptide amidase MpaA
MIADPGHDRARMPKIDYSCFPRYDELVATLQAFATEHPQLVRLETIGRSHEGREIPIAIVTAASTGPAANKPAYWVDGNIHATELSASIACLYLIDTLVAGYGSDPDTTRRAAKTSGSFPRGCSRTTTASKSSSPAAWATRRASI